VSSSLLLHAYTSGGAKSFTNAKAVKASKGSVSIKDGASLKLNLRITKLDKSKRLFSANHVAHLRFRSTNASVAKVSSAGVVTAVAPGTCRIYAFAHNGIWKKIEVTVR